MLFRSRTRLCGRRWVDRFGPNVPDSFRRAAAYVDRILRGASPGDLPVDEASKFDFVVNLRTARTLGLVPTAEFLARVDEIIE